MKKTNTNTTKICLVNNTTGDIIILGNIHVLARYFGYNVNTCINWFRDSVNVFSIDHGACMYTIYKASKYLSKGS